MRLNLIPKSTFGRNRNVVDRFWERVRKSDACWEWDGVVESSGYGSLSVNSRGVRAHRLSWELHYGPIPDGLMVCHHCDNRKCVRPDHLFVGTGCDNMRDAKAKGRLAGRPPRLVGESHPQRKMTERQVLELRRKALGDYSYAELAREYGISYSVARGIAVGKTWRHLPCPAVGSKYHGPRKPGISKKPARDDLLAFLKEHGGEVLE